MSFVNRHGEGCYSSIHRRRRIHDHDRSSLSDPYNIHSRHGQFVQPVDLLPLPCYQSMLMWRVSVSGSMRATILSVARQFASTVGARCQAGVGSPPVGIYIQLVGFSKLLKKLFIASGTIGVGSAVAGTL